MTVEITPKIKKATVTFTTQVEEASQVILAGEWDNWITREMKKNPNGTFSVKVNIDLGRSYQFGYLIDGKWTPDADLPLVASPFGSDNSILDIPKAAPDVKKKPTAKTDRKPVAKKVEKKSAMNAKKKSAAKK